MKKVVNWTVPTEKRYIMFTKVLRETERKDLRTILEYAHPVLYYRVELISDK